MRNRNIKHNRSGQVLVITSLLVALLMLSTAIFVIESEKNQAKIGTAQENVFPLYQQAIKNTLISALANVTGGGDTDILRADIDGVTAAISSYSYQAMLKIDYTLPNNAPYANGFWISRGADGHGVSSVYAIFAFNSSSFSTTTNVEYSVNVTSQVDLSGTYLQLNETSKQVNLTVSLHNEGRAALAQNFTFRYQNVAEWIAADSPSITDFGNGTYTVSFTVQSDQSIITLPVSVVCQDQRGIFIGANATCNME